MAGKRTVDPEPVDRIIRDLRSTRIEQGRGQADVGQRIGVTHGLVNKWETGKRSPTLRNAHAWAASLGLKLVLREE